MTTSTLDYQTPRPVRQTPWNVLILLSAMMFLQYSVWGIWMPFLAGYLTAPTAGGGLGFSDSQMGMILGLAASLGALSAPLLGGQVADRYLNAERALALLLLAGGVLNLVLASTTDYQNFLMLAVAYSICYMPTLSLTNGLAFRNLDTPETQFPPVRLWGTLGWIAAQSLFPAIWLTSTNDAVNTARIADALRVSGCISIAYAVFAFFVLPKTPPKRDRGHSMAVAQALGLFKNRAFPVITLVALPIAMIHQAYFMHVFNYLSGPAKFDAKWTGLVLPIGQWSEIFFLAILGFLIRSVGFKFVFVLGCLAYVGRFLVFGATENHYAIMAAQALHGLCYGCLFAGAFILVAKLTPAEIEHSAQTLFGTIILGLGPIMAVFYNSQVATRFDLQGKATTFANYGKFWWTQAAIAAVAGVVVLLFFPNRVQTQARNES